MKLVALGGGHLFLKLVLTGAGEPGPLPPPWIHYCQNHLKGDLQHSKLIIPVNCDAVRCLNWYKSLYFNSDLTLESDGK